MNAPERIWTTHEDHSRSWGGSFGSFMASDLDHGDEYPEYIRADLVPQWQPIETAPKHDLETLILYSSEGVQIGWFSAFHKCWLTTEGKDVWAEPTHWMPLPTPPADMAAKIGGE